MVQVSGSYDAASQTAEADVSVTFLQTTDTNQAINAGNQLFNAVQFFALIIAMMAGLLAVDQAWSQKGVMIAVAGLALATAVHVSSLLTFMTAEKEKNS